MKKHWMKETDPTQTEIATDTANNCLPNNCLKYCLR